MNPLQVGNNGNAAVGRAGNSVVDTTAPQKPKQGILSRLTGRASRAYATFSPTQSAKAAESTKTIKLKQGQQALLNKSIVSLNAAIANVQNPAAAIANAFSNIPKNPTIQKAMLAHLSSDEFQPGSLSDVMKIALRDGVQSLASSLQLNNAKKNPKVGDSFRKKLQSLVQKSAPFLFPALSAAAVAGGGVVAATGLDNILGHDVDVAQKHVDTAVEQEDNPQNHFIDDFMIKNPDAKYVYLAVPSDAPTNSADLKTYIEDQELPEGRRYYQPIGNFTVLVGENNQVTVEKVGDDFMRGGMINSDAVQLGETKRIDVYVNKGMPEDKYDALQKIVFNDEQMVSIELDAQTDRAYADLNKALSAKEVTSIATPIATAVGAVVAGGVAYGLVNSLADKQVRRALANPEEHLSREGAEKHRAIQTLGDTILAKINPPAEPSASTSAA